MGNMDWILGLGILAAGGWCVFMGPCKEWLSSLTSGGGGGTLRSIGWNPTSSTANRLADNPSFAADFLNTGKQIEGKSEAEAKRIVERNLGKYRSNYGTVQYRAGYTYIK